MRFAFILILHVVLNTLASNTTWYAGFLDKRPFTVHTTRFLCTGQPDYIIVELCKLKLRRNKPSSLSFRGTFVKPFEPIFGSMKIWYKGNVNVWLPLLGIDEWGDICAFLSSKPEQLTMMQQLYRRYLKDILPNYDFRCPIQGTMEFLDFSFEDYMFPPFLPAGSYRNDILFFTEHNLSVFKFQFYGTVRAKGLADLSMG
ncbi:uncharacterized protein LOC110676551 [Aedes aegypti]|uniref:Uncharacterized protein n=1 Tax=Aedes aegypti TaxID=7159 RepID=A0A6I8TY96_AEDAE|nr:uncharacterized protein LOC110676551 [Aedes aegypti]